jgi:hypothetical protein
LLQDANQIIIPSEAKKFKRLSGESFLLERGAAEQ